MIVKNANVTFTNGWIALDALSFTEPSVIVDNARLTLSFNPAEVPATPMVTCNHALIGQLAAARVDIINNSSWLATGSLRVGGPGEGILTLDSGGTVTSGESRIGGAGGGHVNLGAGGSWRTGNLAVGSEGQGDLTIQDGGHVDSDAGFIGLPGSSGSKVILQGGDGNNVSRWDVPYLAVGGGASGELDVKDGALVNSAMAIIAHVAGGDGSVTVSGVGTNGQSSTLSALELLAGQNGNAALNVLDGARVVAGNIFLGEFRSSVSVKVSGINVAEDTPSTLHADGVLAVGDVGPASLLIESGGQAESDWGQIANFVPQTISEVKIVGSASSWTVTNTLTLGYNGSVNAGQSVLTLVAGYLEADSIEVDNGGIVRGFGTLAVDPTNRVVNAGGTISPGLSPGIIIIEGSFKQLAGGQLLMDIGGTNYADNDHLIITNAANLDGNITFRFLNGFAPKQGQQFELLSVGGALTGNFATVGIENLAPGFQFGVVTNGRALSLVASNDGVFSAALPGEVDVTVTNFGGLTYANYTITTSNSCQSIALDGSFTQTGNAFTQTLAGTSFIRSD
jgi:T5SS/PEP-CTERM-associated repeat protein